MLDTQDSIFESDAARETFEAVEGWETRFGIELKSLLDPDHYSFQDARRLMRERLLEGIGRYDGFPADEAGPAPTMRLAAQPVGEVPNFYLDQENAETIAKYKGDDVTRYVGTLRTSLNLMGSASSVAALVETSLSTGVLIVGFEVWWEVRTLMKGGMLFRAALT